MEYANTSYRRTGSIFVTYDNLLIVIKIHLMISFRPPSSDKTFANGSNCRSHKKKAHPIELAQLEASGEQSRATNIPKLEQLQPKLVFIYFFFFKNSSIYVFRFDPLRAMPQDEQFTIRMAETINDSSPKWSPPPPPPPSTPISLPNASPIAAHLSHHLLLQQQLQQHSAAAAGAAADVLLPMLQLSHDPGMHLSANNLGLIQTDNM
jgi:hypothetical protein